MTEQDKPRFALAMTEACSVIGCDAPSPHAMQAWWKKLAHHSCDDVVAALDFHSMHSRFAPKLADVIDYIDGTTDEQAQDRWVDILAAARRGVGSTLGMEPAAARAIEALGGMRRICMATDHELPMIARQFVSYYRVADKPTPALPIDGGPLRELTGQVGRKLV